MARWKGGSCLRKHIQRGELDLAHMAPYSPDRGDPGCRCCQKASLDIIHPLVDVKIRESPESAPSAATEPVPQGWEYRRGLPPAPYGSTRGFVPNRFARRIRSLEKHQLQGNGVDQVAVQLFELLAPIGRRYIPTAAGLRCEERCQCGLGYP